MVLRVVIQLEKSPLSINGKSNVCMPFQMKTMGMRLSLLTRRTRVEHSISRILNYLQKSSGAGGVRTATRHIEDEYSEKAVMVHEHVPQPSML